jgi:hypothetical protein
MALTQEEKMELVKEQAAQRGYDIKFDPRLLNTPYRAMNPPIGRILNQPYIEKTLTYGPCSEVNHDVAMDLNHENIEDWKAKRLLKKGVPKEKIYPISHKFANKRQRNFRFMENKT